MQRPKPESPTPLPCVSDLLKRLAAVEADRDARIAAIARLTAVNGTFEQTRSRLYHENETLTARVKAVGERLLKLEHALAGVRAEKQAVEAVRDGLLAQADAAARTLQDRDQAIAQLKGEITRLTSENQTFASRLAAANQRLALIRSVARENAFRRRHRLHLTLLRWFPPLARLRRAVPESDLTDATLADLLRPPRAAVLREKDRVISDQSSVISEGMTSSPHPTRSPITDHRSLITDPRSPSPQPAPKKRRAAPLKISVITPSFNTGDAIEQAITSVLEQDYPNYEHWVIDGGSTDKTLEILKRHPHLKWISEKDKGQSDAMNKGFERATGDIVVYLNADDTFLPGAFSAVIPAFEAGAQVVMGRVRVVQEKDGLVWENDAKTDLSSMLRHWEANAFCVNPVGYFYRKAVQEQIPFNLANDDKMDLEFLLEVAARFEIVKVDATLGVFNYAAKCKTGKEQSRLDYWRPANFPFVNRLAKALPPDAARRYALSRALGYQQRRAWTLKEVAAHTSPETLRHRPEVIVLPPLAGAAEALLTETDSVIFTLAANAAAAAAADVWHLLSAPFPPEIPFRHLVSDADITALRHFLTQHGPRIQPHLVVLAAEATKPASDAGAPAEALRLLARVLGQQVPPKLLKPGRSLNTFTFRGATIAVVAAEKAATLLPRLAAQWSGTYTEPATP